MIYVFQYRNRDIEDLLVMSDMTEREMELERNLAALAGFETKMIQAIGEDKHVH